MWSFLVVMATPDPTDVIKMFFGHDYELVEALKLQRLDKSFHMGSQVRRHRGVSFHLRPAGFQHFIKLSRILRVVVSHHIFRCEPMSSATIRKFLACRLTHAESGCTERGEIHTCREPRCRNTSLIPWFGVGNLDNHRESEFSYPARRPPRYCELGTGTNLGNC